MEIKISIIVDSFIPSKVFLTSIKKHLKSIRPKIQIQFFTKDFKEEKLIPLISNEVSEAFGDQNDVIKIAKNTNVLIMFFNS